MPTASEFADEVHHITFCKPPIGRRGYDEDQVDQALDDLEAKFRNLADPRLAGLTPESIRLLAFATPPLGMRGYNSGEVDAFLELAATNLAELTGDDTPAGAPSGTLRFGARDVYAVQFGKPRFGKRGYDEAQVDSFLDTVAARFRDPDAPDSAWITPAAIRETWFAKSQSLLRPGYRPDEVDAFMARCADELQALLRDS